MASMPQRKVSPQEYLAAERASQERHEYLDGGVFSMTGASMRHNVIVSNLNAHLNVQFRGRPCRAVANDMRVKVAETGLYTYPDIVALCSEPELEDDEFDTLLNPSVIIEVLSPSTEAYDRGKKFAHYRRLPSLLEYVLVSQDLMRVEHFVRQVDGQWLMMETTLPGQLLRLRAVGAEVALSDIYDKVELNP